MLQTAITATAWRGTPGIQTMALLPACHLGFSSMRWPLLQQPLRVRQGEGMVLRTHLAHIPLQATVALAVVVSREERLACTASLLAGP